MYPKSIQKLIEKFSKFPTVGPRTAARFVFYLLRASKEEIEELIKLISEFRQNIKTCQFCFNPFEGESSFVKTSEDKGELCPICQDKTRNRSLLCIVANETDLTAIEKTKKYQGLYFILGGTVSTFKKEEVGKLRVEELKGRVKNSPEIKEIILALNSTPDGEATTLYLERVLKPFNKKNTRLGRGLPVGGELEYADEETLGSALEGRK